MHAPLGMLPRNHKAPPTLCSNCTCAALTWPTRPCRPIRSAHRCFEMRVSETETCWFSRRKPLLINVSIYICSFPKTCWRSVEILERSNRGQEYASLEVGDVRRQDSLLVRNMDTAATLWRIAAFPEEEDTELPGGFTFTNIYWFR